MVAGTMVCHCQKRKAVLGVHADGLREFMGWAKAWPGRLAVMS